MPVKRKFESVDSRAGKRFKKGKISISNATKINRIVRNIEDKHEITDVPDEVYTFLQGGTVQVFGAMAEGTDDFQRVGRNVHIDSVKFCFVVSGTTVAAPPVALGNTFQGAIRLLWVWDKQPNGALATYGNVLDNASMGAISSFNSDQEKRFVILYDQIRKISGASADPNNLQIFKGKIKVNRQMQFSGTASGIANVTTGALLCLGCTTIAGTYAGTPQSNFSVDVKFTDL